MTARASRARDCNGTDQAHRADGPLDVLLSGVPEMSDYREQSMAYENIIVETTRPRRRHPAQPAAGAERAQPRADRAN